MKRNYLRAQLIAIAVVITCYMLIAPNAYAVTLGKALGFSALSTSGDVAINNVAKVSINSLGDTGGHNVTLGSNSLAGGDAIADTGDITLGNFSKVKGKCITGGGAVNLHLGAKCGSENTSGSSPKLAIMTQAISDVGTFEANLTSATPTQTLPAITVKNYPHTVITDTVSGGLNIIEIPSLTLQNSSTLILSGGASDSLVLEITGDVNIGSGARILVQGGLTVNHVLIYVGGNVASWGNTTMVGATLLAPNTACAAGSGARVTGAIICGGDVTFLQNATLTFNPTLVDIPSSIPPPPLSLGNAAGFLIVSTGGNTKVGNVLKAYPAAPNSGDIGGNADTFGSNSTIDGDVISSNNSGNGISLGNYTVANQACITDGASVAFGIGASCATTDMTGSDPKVAILSGAGSDASAFSAAANSFPVDQNLPAINIAASHSQTVACTASGRNVIDTPSITMGGSSTLTIDCGSGDTVVFNVPGVMTLNSGFKILLTGGITPDRVVFNVEGISGSPALIGGTSSVFNGTMVAAARGCTVSTGATINGQLICGGDITIGANLTATYVPLVTIP